MQGVFIDGRRPTSKKQVREAISGGCDVQIEATSVFGNEFSGDVMDMPQGTIYFVGPDPYTSRSFYGQIVRSGDKLTVR